MILLSACGPDVRLTDGGAGDDDGSGGGGGGGGVDPLDIAKSGSRIKMKVLTSGDGAKLLQGFFDSQRNEDCAFQAASDGMTRCLPTSVAFAGSYFADANCTQAAGYYYANCTPPAYISVPTTSTCAVGGASGPTIYARGGAVASVYVKSGATCVATSLGATFTAYALGAVVAATSFQAATIAVE
jgi:hypothetical protein